MSEMFPEQQVPAIDPLLLSYIEAGNYTAAEMREAELLAEAGEF